MSRWRLKACSYDSVAVSTGLTRAEQESVALAIFLQVSVRFETMQSSWPYKMVTDSGFSAEDLVSNIVGFYRAVRPGKDYIGLCQPVSKAAAENVWDLYGAVGTQKNRSANPFLFPCKECGTNGGPACGVLPEFLSVIIPAKTGRLYREWRPEDPELNKNPVTSRSISPSSNRTPQDSRTRAIQY